MPHRIVQVDAFADRPFAGNPAAICLLRGPADISWMQAVAQEMNLSETAFVDLGPDPGPAAEFGLRWFTPTVEVDLCGHATLAAAHVLWEEGLLSPDGPARFLTRSGRISARRSGDLIALDFPAERVAERPAPAGLFEAIGAEGLLVGGNRMDLLVAFDSEADVRALAPDFARLGAIPARGVIATAPCDRPGVDFVSRFFAPAIGVDEDPVCGSAHCALAPFWAERLGRDALVGHQISRRGGLVRVRVLGERVELAGPAVTVLRGELA